MAKCKLSPQEFIQHSFSPQVAVLCSEDAENICLKNGLRFVELLQPFCKLETEARLNDPAGNSVVVPNLQIIFEDMNNRPPQPTLGKKLLSEVVQSTAWDEPVDRTVLSNGGSVSSVLNFQPTTPWFEAWRKMFLEVQYPSDHEFTKHYVACIIVVSSGSENTLEQLGRLSQYQHQQQHQAPARYPKWFSPNILKFYLLLHDIVDGDLKKGEVVFDQMTTSYGATNCHYLQINSRPEGQIEGHLPDPWSQYLQHKRMTELSSGGSANSETSSGTGTPREDVVGLPSRVSEGDTVESPDSSISHPLSPSPLLPQSADDKNDLIEGIPSDVPVLLINSNSFPDIENKQHGACLTPSDLDRIQIFIREFCVRSLLPYVERQIRYLNEAVTNRSRSKSLLSATRRWLGGNKSPGSVNNSVIYSPEATELQIRRLGDLCFMFGLYEAAFSAYHTAKNDFKNDQAWLYFAGAQEMAALAAFMNNPNDFPKRYLEGSIHTYLNVCKVYNFAIRATILSCEVLKHVGETSDAAMMMIKLTSEECDLLSALMLEQAAHCFINYTTPLPRKYAFHMTLAGHRFSKAGQRAHSFRAYQQAFQVYCDKGWSLADDHIHFTMGKQAQHLKHVDAGLEFFNTLVDHRKIKLPSCYQSSSQQLAYLREFFNAYVQSIQQRKDINDSVELYHLPLPNINCQTIKVILGSRQNISEDKHWNVAADVSFEDDDSKNQRWFSLERELLNVAISSTSFTKVKPNLSLLTSNTPNSNIPFVPVNETIFIEIMLHNPLFVSLTLRNVHLTYKFVPDNSGTNVSSTPPVEHKHLSEFDLLPGAEYKIKLEMFTKCLGQLFIQGLSYQLSLTPDPATATTATTTSASVAGIQMLKLNGPRLNTTAVERSSEVYATDRRLEITIIPKMPLLQVWLKNFPSVLSCGELCAADVKITNIGQIPLKKLLLAICDPKHIYFALKDSPPPEGHVSTLKETLHNTSQVKPRVSYIDLPEGCLQPNQSIEGKLWLHAPLSHSHNFDIELLFYYEPTTSNTTHRYRLLRHFQEVVIEPSLSVKVLSSFSQSVPKDDKSTPSNTVNLVIEVNNITSGSNGSSDSSSERIINIIGITTNSPSWAVLPQTSFEGPQEVKIGEEARLCVRCVQQKHLSTSSIQPQQKKQLQQVQQQLTFSYIPFSFIQIPLLCWWLFTVRERIEVKNLLAKPAPPNPAADLPPPTPSPLQQDIQHIKNSSHLDLYVTVLWKSKRCGKDIWGQHTVKLEEVGDSSYTHPPSIITNPSDGEVEPSSAVTIIPKNPRPIEPSLIPEKLQQQNLVKLEIDFPKSLNHNFDACRLCSIEFKVVLHNCCGCLLKTDVDFSQLDDATTINEGSSQLFVPEASMQLICVGTTVRHFSLTPWGSKTFKLHALVTSAGTYCLGKVKLTCLNSNCLPNQLPVTQLCQLQSAVTVRQQPNTVRQTQTS